MAGRKVSLMPAMRRTTCGGGGDGGGGDGGGWLSRGGPPSPGFRLRRASLRSIGRCGGVRTGRAELPKPPGPDPGRARRGARRLRPERDRRSPTGKCAGCEIDRYAGWHPLDSEIALHEQGNCSHLGRRGRRISLSQDIGIHPLGQRTAMGRRAKLRNVGEGRDRQSCFLGVHF